MPRMDYYAEAERLIAGRAFAPLTNIYIEMTDEFYKEVSELVRGEVQGTSDEKLADVLDRASRDLVSVLRTWRDFGHRSADASRELADFEEVLRTNPLVFAEVTAVIESLQSQDEDNGKKKKKAKEASDTIKKLIPDHTWCIDLKWLKKVLNEILGIFL